MLINQNLQWHYRYNFFILSYGALTLFFLSSFIISSLVCLLLKLNLFFFDNERRSAFVNKLKPEFLFIPTFVFLFSESARNWARSRSGGQVSVGLQTTKALRDVFRPLSQLFAKLRTTRSEMCIRDRTKADLLKLSKKNKISLSSKHTKAEIINELKKNKVNAP